MTGIDYGRGKTNIDTATGVRFGILSANTRSLSEWFWEDVESKYTARCPKCGNDATGIDTIECTDGWEEAEYDFPDFACECCEYVFGESAYGDEPDARLLSADGYEGFVGDHNDIWVTKSPYRTFGRFCSPCAPGAVSIGTDGNAECYCLGPEWFTDESAPYDIWEVKDGEYVKIYSVKSE